MESGPKKIRELGEKYLESLKCFKCQKEIRLFCGFDDVCEKCIGGVNGVNLYCEKCKIKCKLCRTKIGNGSVKLRLVSEFFNVFCEDHGDTIASNVIEPYWIAACDQCLINYKNNAKRIQYKEIENAFFESYAASSSKLLSDRKKLLITKDLKGLLKATQWLYMLTNGLPCTNHCNSQGQFITKNFEVLCSKCNKDSEAHSLNAFTQTGQFLQDCLKAALKQVDPSRLSKYLLNLIKFSAKPTINNAFDMNLLILEGKDFIQGNRTYNLRCVYCLCKLSVEWKKGIQLNCDHLACFKCIFQFNIQSCPIDNQPVTFELYLTPDLCLPSCHQMHSFTNADKIFKLPCQHFTCESHLATKYCFECGFDMDFCGFKPKPSNNAQNLIKLYKPHCLIHQKPYEYFYYLNLLFLCEDCLIGRDKKYLFRFNSDQTRLIEELLEDLLTESLSKVKEEASLSTAIMRNYTYIGIKGYQFRLNFLTCVRLLYTDPLLKYEKFSCKEIKMFNKQSDPYKGQLKVLENLEFTFTITPFEDLIIAGVILTNNFFVHFNLGLNYFIESCEIKVFNSERIEYKELQITMDGVIFEESKDPDTTLAYCKPFVARMDLIYVFIYKVKPGSEYFKSIACSKLKSELLELGSYWDASKTNDSINGSLGGLLYGLLAEPLSSIL